ncbi:MAG: osmoprotectant transport system permease protein [Rhodospirillaceae bacterium]|jgi:osmoprotectant transport system permease protein|nr:osmoprotectant transport system permease protein [Rhodospirillaceae bacterium]
MSLTDYWEIFGPEIMRLVWRHLLLVAISVAAATAVGVLAGVAVAKDRRFGFLVPVTNTLQAAPELVLLAIAIPFLGIGVRAALIALFIKGVLPILRNTYSGLTGVEPSTLEAARGMGMSGWQQFIRIELPIAAPAILSGVRVSAVMLVSVLTLSAYISVDSLGTLIVQGIARMDFNALFTGSVLTALFAVVLNYGLLILEQRLAARLK